MVGNVTILARVLALHRRWKIKEVISNFKRLLNLDIKIGPWTECKGQDNLALLQ